MRPRDLWQPGDTSVFALVDSVTLTPHLPFLAEGVHHGLLTVHVKGVTVFVRRNAASGAEDGPPASASHRSTPHRSTNATSRVYAMRAWLVQVLATFSGALIGVVVEDILVAVQPTAPVRSCRRMRTRPRLVTP